MNGEFGEADKENKANDGLDKVPPIPSDPSLITDGPARSTKNETTNQTDWQRRHYWMQFAVFFVGVIVAFIYACQLSEMRKSTHAATKAAQAAKDSVTFARENARLDQRPWVTVEFARILKQPALDETPTITLHIRNSGKTPARKVHLASSVYVGEHADIAGRDREPIGPPTEGLIGPGAGADSTFSMISPITDKKQLDSVMTNETAYIYIIGVIYYIDVFDKTHRTVFCYHWNDKQAPVENHLFMQAAETGNEAD